MSNVETHKIESVAVNLLWLRPGGVGGTEFFTRNLLDGFMDLKEEFKLVLVCTENNADSFLHYTSDNRFSIIKVPISNLGIMNRIMWQNLHLNSFLKKRGIRKCFSPVYDKPYFNMGIEYVCVIHDIMAVHFPEYQPFHVVVYSKMIWHSDSKNKKSVATTYYSKEDIIKHFGFKDENVDVIYISIPDENKMKVEYGNVDDVEFDKTETKFGLKPNEPYFYTISQMIPNKNMTTLVKLMALIKEKYPELPHKLLVSGISGNGTDEFDKAVAEAGVSDCVIKTGFVSNAEKVALYKHCDKYLFASIFEGFGMTPIEAMRVGATVVTTKCTTIPEVTQGLCNYVEDPYDLEEWVSTIKASVNRDDELDMSKYDEKLLAHQYYKLLFN